MVWTLLEALGLACLVVGTFLLAGLGAAFLVAGLLLVGVAVLGERATATSTSQEPEA